MLQACALPDPTNGQGQLFAEALDLLVGVSTHMCSRLLAMQEAAVGREGGQSGGYWTWGHLSPNLQYFTMGSKGSKNSIFEPGIPDYFEDILVKVNNRIYFIFIYNFNWDIRYLDLDSIPLDPANIRDGLITGFHGSSCLSSTLPEAALFINRLVPEALYKSVQN